MAMQSTRTLSLTEKFFFSSKATILASFAILPLLLAGCMSSQREEELQGSIRTLDAKIVDLEKQLQNKANTSEEANRRVQSNKSEVEELRRQLSLTQGAVDELRVKLGRLQESGGAGRPMQEDSTSIKLADLEDSMQRMERRVTRLELSGPNESPAPSKDKGKDKGPKFKSAAELNKALSAAYAQKDYKKVISLASSVIAGDAGDDLKETALLFRAEAYFATQGYDKAALDFADFLDKYPKSEKRARALLLAGDSFVYLKQNRTAKSYYSECVRNFTDRDECKAAKERLDKLGV